VVPLGGFKFRLNELRRDRLGRLEELKLPLPIEE
jgi:hypothetical protein